jgi:hypothetical protein
MTSALKKKLDEIRAIAPELNSAIDEANGIVKHVEKVLVEEAAIGVSAEADAFLTRMEASTAFLEEQVVEKLVRYRLCFGRVNGAYCINVMRTEYGDFNGAFTREEDSDLTPWSSCDRDTRIAAFEKLPQLIDVIIDKARKLAESTKRTVDVVRELIMDESIPNEIGAPESFEDKMKKIDPRRGGILGGGSVDPRRGGVLGDDSTPLQGRRRPKA